MKTTTKTTTMQKIITTLILCLSISLLLLGSFAVIEPDRVRQFIGQYVDLELIGLGKSSDDMIERILNQDQPKAVIESSKQQDLKMQQLYIALQSQDVKQVLPLLDPSLQQQIKHSPETIEDIFRLMPEGEYDRWQVALRSQSVAPKVGPITTLVYVFDYTLDMLAITVMFKGHEEGATIMAFSIDRLKK